MIDKVLVFISLIGLIVFCGVVVGFVAEPDLVIVTSLILALAAHDFWISVFSKKEPSKLDTHSTLEAVPSAVSGKPLTSATLPEEKTTRSKSKKRGTAAKKS